MNTQRRLVDLRHPLPRLHLLHSIPGEVRDGGAARPAVVATVVVDHPSIWPPVSPQPEDPATAPPPSATGPLVIPVTDPHLATRRKRRRRRSQTHPSR